MTDERLSASSLDASSGSSAASLGGARQLSLRTSLALLVLLCALPALAVSIYLAVMNLQLKRQVLYSQAEVLARRISAQLDSELSAIESGLNVLATSETLRRGEFERFHGVASDALKTQTVYNYVLTDSAGRQVMNTVRPWGSVLPQTGTPAQIGQVFSRGETVLTDLFPGPVVGRPVLAMGVPVLRGSEVVYSLNVGLSPDRINRVLLSQTLPEGWLVAVLDSSGAIVGRSRDAERFVGQKAVPALLERVQTRTAGSLETLTKEGQRVMTFHLPLPRWPWTLAIGAPKSTYEAELARLAGFLAGALALFGLGLWLAVRQANRVLSSVQQLNDAALALGDGKAVRLPTVQLYEAQAVGQAIVQASQLMADVRHRANHDLLTGLANRGLFMELAQLQLASAERELGPLALLAIDLDNFKQVNDEQGHACGDQLLKAVAARIEQSIRANDVAARTGGDEFLVLLAHADEAVALDLGRRLLAALRQPYEGVRAEVSASIGIAVYPHAGQTLTRLLESADRALYEAKRAGRDTSVVAR
ncbi:MAG: GGDEF domain-containing protein [Methylibium sp.]|nr:GGDEF domain-containing protein [Methylibium sp.]